MNTTLDEKIASLSAARQQKINLATEALIVEEQTIQDLRKALSAIYDKKQGISQESFSRIEFRSLP
jgi:hypothetical protein